MKKLKLYKRNKSQKSKLSEIFDVVKNADQRACYLLTLLTPSGTSLHSSFNSFEFQCRIIKILLMSTYIYEHF